MAGYYRRQVASLHGLLERGPEIERMKATEMLRSLISAIVLTPDDTGLAIDVQGDLAGILAIATAENAKNPGVFTSGISQLKMVAGTRCTVSITILGNMLTVVAGAGFPCWYNFVSRSYTDVGCGRAQSPLV